LSRSPPRGLHAAARRATTSVSLDGDRPPTPPPPLVAPVPLARKASAMLASGDVRRRCGTCARRRPACRSWPGRGPSLGRSSRVAWACSCRALTVSGGGPGWGRQGAAGRGKRGGRVGLAADPAPPRARAGRPLWMMEELRVAGLEEGRGRRGPARAAGGGAARAVPARAERLSEQPEDRLAARPERRRLCREPRRAAALHSVGRGRDLAACPPAARSLARLVALAPHWRRRGRGALPAPRSCCGCTPTCRRVR